MALIPLIMSSVLSAYMSTRTGQKNAYDKIQDRTTSISAEVSEYINKGYAVFREVNIVDQNEEFCIVNPENTYGLSAHDRIALDACKVKEDEIIA